MDVPRLEGRLAGVFGREGGGVGERVDWSRGEEEELAATYLTSPFLRWSMSTWMPSKEMHQRWGLREGGRMIPSRSIPVDGISIIVLLCSGYRGYSGGLGIISTALDLPGFIDSFKRYLNRWSGALLPSGNLNALSSFIGFT